MGENLFANTAPIVKYGIGPALAELGHEVRYVFLDQEPSLEPYIDEFKPDIVFNDGVPGACPSCSPSWSSGAFLMYIGP